MSSKPPSPENTTADCQSQSSLNPPHEVRRDNVASSMPTETTTNSKDNHSAARGTNGDTSSTTKASNNIVAVSGSPKDIICGRGLHVISHHGNYNLHLMVDRYRQAYLPSTRKKKAAITRRIVQELKNTGARFLRRLNDDENDDDKRWVEVDDKTAYKKVSHALRLRKSGGHQQQNLSKSLHPGQQQQHQLDNNSQRSLHSTTARITDTSGTSQNVAGMPMIGPQNPMQHHTFGLSHSPSLAMQRLHLHLSLPSPLENQLQMASYSQPQSILPLSALSGHGSVVVDPQLFSQVFTSTLAIMAQSSLQQQQQQQQPSSLFDNNASSADSHSNRYNQKNPNEERRGYR